MSSAVMPPRRVELHSPYGFFRREATQIPNGTRGTVVEGKGFNPLIVDWDGYGEIQTPSHWVGPVDTKPDEGVGMWP